ncbi:MAG: transporter substrate-binding domain-containing protein [Pseudodesulfovibrio sp.]
MSVLHMQKARPLPSTGLWATVYFCWLFLVLSLLPYTVPSAHAASESISVVYATDVAPFEFQDKAGNPAGMMIDYWKLWSEKTGVSVNFVPAAWNDTLTMVKEGRADAHAGLFYNKERDAYLSYSLAPLTKTDAHIFYHESLPELAGGKELFAYRVGVLDDDFVEGFLTENYLGISLVPYKAMDDVMAALKSGALKVFAADTPVALSALRKSGLSGEFQYAASKPLYQNDWLVAVPEGKTDVLKRIEEGMAAITPQEKLAITRRWSSTGESRDANTLVIAMDRNYPPFYFIDTDGKPKGLFVDIWKRWAEITSTQIDFRPSNWAGTLGALKAGEADVHSGLFKSAEREKWINFSDSFYAAPSRLYCKAGDTPIPLSEMKGKRVGVIEGALQEHFLRKTFPDVVVVPIPDTDGLILTLLKGTIDAFVNGAINTDIVLTELGMQDAIISHPDSVFFNSFHAGILKGKAELLNTINEGIATLSWDELARIESRWISNPDNRYFTEKKKSLGSVALTKQEAAWLRVHPTIRIANETDWPPYDFVQDGKPAGWSVDFIKLVAAKVGINIEWVNGYAWKELVQMGKDRKLDVIQCISKTSEREQFFEFTPSYHTSSVVIFTRPEHSSIKNIGDLKGMKVAVINGFTQQKHLTKHHPDIEQIEVDSALEGLTSVSLSKADAYIDRQTVCQYYIKENNIPGVVFASLTGVPEFDVKKMNASVRKDWPELAAILNKGIAAVTPAEVNKLNSEWFGMEDDGSSGVTLTSKEKSWITQHPVIRIGATPDWPPFEFKQGDKHAGLAADILRLAAERTGLKLDIQFNAWGDILKGLKEKTLDVCPGIVKNPQREEFINFTDVIFISQIAIWVKKTTQDIASFEDLEGRTVAVEEGYASHDLLAKKYPKIKLLLVTSPIDCIRAVSSGKADAYLGNQASTSYMMNQNVITNLKPVAYYDEGLFKIRMGARKDWPLLIEILNKGLASVSIKEKNDILAQYISNEEPAVNKVVLTDDEKQWIADHKDIRLGVDPSWAPFECFQGVTYSGLSAEHVKLLAKDTGLTFAPPPILNWTEVIRLAKEQKLDVLPAVTRTPEREKHLSFSKSYGKFPIVIYQRTNDIPVTGMDDLDGKSVAVVSGYAIEEFLNENHSDILVEPFRTLDKALMALSTDRVDALAGNIVAVEHTKQTHSLFNVVPTIKTPYVQELHFGVREDWGTLVRIIDKWLATVDAATEARMARDAGVNLDTEFVAEAVEKSIDFTQLMLIGGAIILVFGAALIILLFIRRFIGSRAETLYSSHQYKTVGIVLGILFLCLVVVATWLALARVETKARESMGDVLESILLTTHESLAIWERQNKLNIIKLTDDPVLRGLTGSLLSLPDDAAVIESSPQLWNIRKFMDKVQVTRGFVDYSIVSKNFLNYATPDNPDLLDKNIISIQRPRVLDKAMLGSTIFVPPTTFESDHEGDHGKGEMSIVSIASPINGQDGKVLAVLILYYNVADDYQRIIALGRLGKTGETYAFDRNGSLMSTNRFDDMVHSLGLVEENQKAIINLRVADPGGNLVEGYALDKDAMLPLTVSVKSATARKTGRNLEGYRDYRGVPVYGAWLWDDELGLGLVTEIDVDEALGSFRLVRNTVIAVIFITILLGSLMTGLSNWIGQSAAKSLLKAKEELEDRVEERTADLKKISVAVEQSSAMVLITDMVGIIQYVNPRFAEITGFTSEEAVGKNPKILNSGSHPRKFFDNLWDTVRSGKSWNSDILNKKKNGQLFWVRVSIAPIVNDNSELTNFVAVMEDITDRKAQEERFQALLDAAPDAMVIVAPDGEITLVNIATEELFDYTREEMIGQKVEILLPDYIRKEHPAHRGKVFAAPGDMSLVAGKEFYGQTKAGDQIPVDISLNPIETDDGVQMIASIRDITERKKAEAAIAESEERTRLILSSAGEGIFGVNLEGEVVFINEAACAMVGYASDEMMGNGVHEIIHHTRADGSFYPVEECPMRHAFVQGVSSRIDDEVLWRKDGSSFPVEYAAVPVLRGTEKIGAVISFQDITQRKAAQEALRKSEEEVKNILATAAEGFWRIDNDIITQDVNDAMCEIMGRTREEVIGMHMFEFLDEDNINIVKEQLKRRAKGESGAYDLSLIRPDGSQIPAIFNAAPLYDSDGVKIGSFGMVSDITDRKKAEQEVLKAMAVAEDALSVVTSSIQYASRIQRSILPPKDRIERFTEDHFVVWEPRDVVGGDFYCVEPWGRGHLILLGDCTGHGVPGAFMTLISTGALERSLLEVPPGDSARLLSRMHQMTQMQLGQHKDDISNSGSDDGLELGICYIPPKGKKIIFAGARMPLFIDDGETITAVKSDKKGIGYRGIPLDFEYTNHEIKVTNNMRFFMTSDGVIDQVGGEKRRGFGKKRFITLLESLRDTPLQNQGEKIYSELKNYEGKEKRRDDVSIIGFKL